LSETDECFSYERLRVWQKAIKFADSVYQMTKGFPQSEMFGLASQLRRASVSVAANIAEGSSRTSGRDRARFVEIAYGSLCEVATLLQIAYSQGMVTPDQVNDARSQISGMFRMLSGLKRSSLEQQEPVAAR